MSQFGGFGSGGSGTGGFGSNNTPSSGFGGFGSNTSNTGTGFGSNTSNNTPGFGTPASAGGGIFGSGSTTTGFGSNNATGGFGSTNNTSAFGAKPSGFGTTSSAGGGLFGNSTTATSGTGFGGFGASNTNNTSTSTPFGGGAGSSLFGGSAANKPAFGSTTTSTPGGVFGSSNTNTGTTSAFGAFGNATNNATNTGLSSAGDPPGTANVTNFQPLIEKENATSTASNSFQSILFQDAYKKWSTEELRLADYGAGRRFGGTSGSNAFGVGSGFGSFGSSTQASTGFGNSGANTTGGGLFGNTPTTGGAFGQTNTSTNAFGSNTGGSIFGSKPAATGGLFGNASTSQPAQSAGAFGSSNTSGFGTNTGGSAFGAPNNNASGGLFANNQSKPGFPFGSTGGFGSPATNAFGGNTNTNATAGAFPNTGNATTGSGLFGGSNQQTTSAFGNTGGFGSQNQQQQQQQTSGFLSNNQQKPPGTSLFGGTNTASSGLFGNNANNGTGFGQPNAAQTGGGLFGNKPATGSTGGLFGGSNTTQNSNTGGGLFSSLGQNNQNQQQQPQQGSSLFGALGQSQQKPSLFGGSTQSTGTPSLFGGQNPQQQSSMFGASTAQQPQNGTMGSSLFGSTQGAQQNATSLTASVNDPNAYGPLFANFGSNEVVNPGPLATPISQKQNKRTSILPYYKLNPASASRFVTPQKRGYGLSYSTYGTPSSSGSSVSSAPSGLSQSMLGVSLSRNLGKSMSASNLRRSLNVEDSVLVPGAFSTGSAAKMHNNSNVKKLVINKDLRSDLFSTPMKDKSTPDSSSSSGKLIKRVSFDTSNMAAIENGSATNGSSSSTPSAEQLGYVRPKPVDGVNGSKHDASQSTPEMEQVKGNELAIVHENEGPQSSPPNSKSSAPRDGEPGDYWMSPTKDEIQNMNRIQRQKVSDFTVGRQNIGYVKFRVPVDLTTIDLDTICNHIVVLAPRSATVYPSSVKKPPVGKGLNVPALITLENAFPRASRVGKAVSINKHVERLKRIKDTKFENYNADTGEWSFSVEHFTTYGLEDEDDDETAELTTTEVTRAKATSPVDSDQADDPHQLLNHHPLPGAFESHGYDDNGVDEAEIAEVMTSKQSFLANRSAGSAFQALVPLDQDNMDDEYAMSEVNDDTSDHHGQHLAAEHNDDSFDGSQSDLPPETPAGIMRARMRSIKISETPMKVQVAAGDDWQDMLKKTTSPQKRDRALLKSIREADSYPSARESVREASPIKKRIISDSKGFATSIDLMNSLFEKAKAPTENLQASIRPTGVKWPYKRVTKHLDQNDMDDRDRTWHATMRPTWGPGGSFIFSYSTGVPTFGRSARLSEKNGLMTVMKGCVVSEFQDIRIAKFTNEMSAKAIGTHSKLARVHIVDGVPTIQMNSKLSLKDFSVAGGTKNSAEEHEQLVWELASILFDNVKIPLELQGDPDAIEKLRRENLSKLWESMVEERTIKAIIMAHTPEEKALAALSGHRVAEACKHLLEGKDFRLATLLSLIGTNDDVKKDMKVQLREWQNANVMSEFSQPIRALYEMLSGNVCACEGTKGPVENRTEPFIISRRFGLNWQQAFGLRLWYAISADGSIAEAFSKYKQDVEQDKELHPDVWFIQQGIPAIWDDPRKESREDLLWGLLKLYSDSRADLEAIIRPENSQLSPLDYRLCWQLGQGLASTGLIFVKNAAEKLDAATTSFAAQLTNEGSWLEAVFVLLHLTDADARVMAVQDHLCRHASLIGNDESTTFQKLAGDFKIPTQWIWQAKALYMRSVKKDATAEVQCLLRAECWAEAHQTFIKEVAPRTIIEHDYDGLADVLQQFEGRHSHVPGWNVGGEVYKAFLQLMGFHRRAENPPQMLVNNLLESLPAMHGNTPQAGVVEYAALTEMAAEVAKVVAGIAKVGELNHDQILRLPLTEDVLLKHSRDLAWSHYNAIMAGY